MIVTGVDKKIETLLIEQFDVTNIEQGILDKFLPVKTPIDSVEKQDNNLT